MFESLNATYIAVLIGCVLVSMVIHEFMHAFVSHKLGDTTASDSGRLTLNPLKHIDPFMTLLLPVISILLFHVPILAAKPVPFNPARLKYDEFGAALVAAAGPFSNLLLAFVAALLAQTFNFGAFGLDVLTIFAQLNVALFVFNMIPIPPLDGSRILYAFSPKPVQDFLEQIEPYGFFIVFGLVLLPVFGFGVLLTNLNQFVLNLLP